MSISTCISKESTRNQLIHTALLHLASKRDRNELNVSIEKLVEVCGISQEAFIEHFHSVDAFLSAAVERMKKLFVQQVQNLILTSSFKDKNRVWYFLRCVERYFEQFPEAGYLFTMSFHADIVVSDTHIVLQKYFDVWKETLVECLSTFATAVISKRITDIYLISLRGQLQRAYCDNVIACSFYSDQFLTHTLFNI